MLLDLQGKSVSRLGGNFPARVAPEQISLAPAPPRPPPGSARPRPPVSGPAEPLFDLGPAVPGSAVTSLLVFVLTALVCFSCLFLFLLLSSLARRLLAASKRLGKPAAAPGNKPALPGLQKSRSLQLPELASTGSGQTGHLAAQQGLGRDSLMQTLHLRFKKRMSADSQSPADNSGENSADFLENGKFSRTFTQLEKLGNGDNTLYKVLHRFEGKKYLVQRVAVQTAGRQLRGHELVQRLATAVEFCHPGLARYVTYWAERDCGTEQEQPPKVSRSRSEHLDGATACWAVPARSMQSLPEAAAQQSGSVYLFIQSELCGGSSLEEQLGSLVLNSQDVFHIFTKVAEAVGYLNVRGVRPATLSLRSVRLVDGEVKLTDFLRTDGVADESARKQTRRLAELLLQLLCCSSSAELKAEVSAAVRNGQSHRKLAGAEGEAVAFLRVLLREESVAVERLLKSGEYLAWRDAVLQSFIVTTDSN